MKIAILLFSLAAFATLAKDPDYTGTEHWPTTKAFVHLKNAGLTDNDKVDFTKTKTTRIASEKIGKDLYRQVHHVVFTEKSGTHIEVITVNVVSSDEGSISDVDVFVVSKHLGSNKDAKPTPAAAVSRRQ